MVAQPEVTVIGPLFPWKQGLDPDRLSILRPYRCRCRPYGGEQAIYLCTKEDQYSDV